MLAGRAGGASGTSEQVETPKDGIFCAILNIARRKPGPLFMRSLSHQLLAMTHWKALGHTHRQSSWCDWERGTGSWGGLPSPRSPFRPGTQTSGPRPQPQAAVKVPFPVSCLPIAHGNTLFAGAGAAALSLFTKYKRPILN